MSEYDDNIGERDLLAYVDGLLDQHPAQRARVEVHLRANPDAAARARAYIKQTQEIRDHYDHVLAEPVPPALTAVLTRVPNGWRGRAFRIAAGLALAIVGGSGGWMANQLLDAPRRDDSSGFVARAVASYRAPAPSQATVSAGTAAAADLVAADLGAADLVTEQVAVSIGVPDLAALGLRPVDRRRLAAPNGNSEVQIVYADAEGHRVALVVGTRWQQRSPEIQVGRADGLAVAHWQDGPFRYGLVANGDGPPLRALAEAIVRYQEREIEAVPVRLPDLRAVDVGPQADLPGSAATPSRIAPAARPQTTPSVN